MPKARVARARSYARLRAYGVPIISMLARQPRSRSWSRICIVYYVNLLTTRSGQRPCSLTVHEPLSRAPRSNGHHPT
jgi:hypothetical protein